LRLGGKKEINRKGTKGAEGRFSKKYPRFIRVHPRLVYLLNAKAKGGLFSSLRASSRDFAGTIASP
jgi:hypothetical protein